MFTSLAILPKPSAFNQWKMTIKVCTIETLLSTLTKMAILRNFIQKHSTKFIHYKFNSFFAVFLGEIELFMIVVKN